MREEREKIGPIDILDQSLLSFVFSSLQHSRSTPFVDLGDRLRLKPSKGDSSELRCTLLIVFSAIAMADEELVDQKKYYEESCKPKCVKSLLEYQACVKRIQDDDSGHKHCTGQYFDYWSCVDKCVAPKLFVKLK
ncbi:hypothetical protein HYC85_024383 [Camellia sinensis]|uniref:Complex III subunit VI n=2 Tax=Camellia sinensis TaxID=4442 RepID=A0A7J7G8D5_CAMSI|nr:hypothetical protein HYC85_024383 [Camellia sinensis]